MKREEAAIAFLMPTPGWLWMGRRTGVSDKQGGRWDRVSQGLLVPSLEKAGAKAQNSYTATCVEKVKTAAGGFALIRHHRAHLQLLPGVCGT